MRFVLGANASPFLAQCIYQEQVWASRNKYLLAVETMLQSTYMDDSMDSATDADEGVAMYEQLSSVCWKETRIRARKWRSNSKTAMEKVPLSCLELQSVKALRLLPVGRGRYQ
eukprot:scpid102485/ scgid17986/ 